MSSFSILTVPRFLIEYARAYRARRAKPYTSDQTRNNESSLFDEARFEDIAIVFRIMLGRTISRHECETFIGTKARISDMINIVMNSNELKRCVLGYAGVSDTGLIDDYSYRIPTELCVNQEEIAKVLVVGSCLIESMVTVFRNHYPNTTFDFIDFHNASPLPAMSDDEVNSYDFQISQISLRGIIHESSYMKLRYDDSETYQLLFDRSCQILKKNVDVLISYNQQIGLPVFIINFQAPQQNPVGRQQERYTLSNMAYFIEQLNVVLYEHVHHFANVYIIDLNEIASMYGKKYIGEDLIFVTSHGAFLVDIESHFDEPRLESLGSAKLLYGSRSDKYMITIMEEARSVLRTVKQADAVKLVIFDLDDTLWRGVIAEKEEVDPHATEGWPIGLVEAASYLWRRGILIAIVSKNSVENVERIWGELYASRFPLNNFVKVIADWRPKSVTIKELLSSINILPESTLFVDDNPVERAAVKAAIPEIRTLEAPLVSWRRILLWSSETQRVALTSEAFQRTETTKAQVRREVLRYRMSHTEFLHNLNTQLKSETIRSLEGNRFYRCIELINKTNQFNTTGRRWGLEEAKQHFDTGGYWLAFDVEDVYIKYGTTAVISISENSIEQFVLSCRVFGMEIELAALSVAKTLIRRAGYTEVLGVMAQTDKNRLCRDIFARAGFVATGEDLWQDGGAAAADFPEHIRIDFT